MNVYLFFVWYSAVLALVVVSSTAPKQIFDIIFILRASHSSRVDVMNVDSSSCTAWDLARCPVVWSNIEEFNIYLNVFFQKSQPFFLPSDFA